MGIGIGGAIHTAGSRRRVRHGAILPPLVSSVIHLKHSNGPVPALNFRPPQFALSDEVEWVLRRALGPLEWRPPSAISGRIVADIAVRLDLAVRIAARHPRERLDGELGRDAAEVLRKHFYDAVAQEALLKRGLEMVLREARAFGVPCILLKYAALSRFGVLRVGGRTATDLDVLVPRAHAKHFQDALKRNGYKASGLPESNHQLPALRDPNGILVEVHVHVPGVTVGAGQPFADADQLIGAGLTRQVDDALLPDPAFVVAHALAHSLVQHARAPHMYSPLKAFADLADLQVSKCTEIEEAGRFLSAAMTPEDQAAAFALARALSKGDLTQATDGAPGVLLRHAIASQLDGRYVTRLRLRVLTQRGPASVHITPRRILAFVRAMWSRTRLLFNINKK